ncbi:MAG TPA: DNA-formamidopyrimidine glycosylase family protein [Solirubrobacteraceae bacterium]|jgi:endonuclease-8|nr:DNA-formamidopyrimidine glycosylase family protein [Solirubrobacteraceae bacterium]
MPEGDTIHHAARRIGAVLLGRVPQEIRTPQPRHAMDLWPEQLAGRAVEAVDAHGKHLFLRFEGGLTLHSHLRMTGSWGVHREGARWRRAARRAWIVISAGEWRVVEFDGPLLELLRESRTRFDRRLAALGPDVIGERFDLAAVLARLRAQNPTRAVGEALLDQRVLAGIGNVWKSESCFAAAVNPWRALERLRDEEAVAILEFAHERMTRSAALDGFSTRPRVVYKRAGQPCERCGARIRSHGQGDENRTTYWCPGCQL